MQQKTKSSNLRRKHSAEPLIRLLMNPISRADLFRKARALIRQHQQQKPLVLGQAPPDLSSQTLAQLREQYRLAQSVAAESNQLPPQPPMVR